MRDQYTILKLESRKLKYYGLMIACMFYVKVMNCKYLTFPSHSPMEILIFLDFLFDFLLLKKVDFFYIFHFFIVCLLICLFLSKTCLQITEWTIRFRNKFLFLTWSNLMKKLHLWISVLVKGNIESRFWAETLLNLVDERQEFEK